MDAPHPEYRATYYDHDAMRRVTVMTVRANVDPSGGPAVMYVELDTGETVSSVAWRQRWQAGRYQSLESD